MWQNTLMIRMTVWRGGLFISLLFLILLPRVWGITKAVSPDEPKWLTRAGNFYSALTSGNWADTYQVEHPGVPVMYAGMIGFLVNYPEFAFTAPTPFKWDTGDMERWLTENTDVLPLTLLVGGRWTVVLLSTIVLTLSFFPLRHLFGLWGAVIATLFAAWSPLGMALSQRLHPDGLQSMLIVLGLSAFLAWLNGGKSVKYLILAGIAAGLAGLTKTPAFFLVLTGVILLVTDWWQSGRTRKEAMPALRALLLWGGVAFGIFCALWPAMWAQPLATLAKIAAALSGHAEGHSNPNFFWGQVVADPGILFYPVALLFRMTPATMIGLVIVGIMIIANRPSIFSALSVRRTLFGYVLFAVVFIAGMTLGAKKSDRYLLPALLALDIVAAIGWVGAAQVVWETSGASAVRRHLPHGFRAGSTVLALGVLVILHGLPAFLHAPYYFSYFNPLVGGVQTAPRMLVIGWGEGLDMAGRWLNEYDQGRSRPAVASYSLGSLSYYYDHQSIPFSSDQRRDWLEADYAVTYINQEQRLLPDAETLAFFSQQNPVFTYRFHGIEFVRIYDLVDTLPPPVSGIDAQRIIDFGDSIRLLTYEIVSLPGGAGQPKEIALHLKSIAPIDIDASVLLRLYDANDVEVWRSEGWPWGAPTSQWPNRQVRRDAHSLSILDDLPDGLYKLTVGFYDSETLAFLPATRPSTGELLSDEDVAIMLFQIGDLSPSSVGPDSWNYGETIRLVNYELPARVDSDSGLPISLTWESIGATSNRYKVFVHVLDRAGNLVAQVDQEPLNGFAPTNLWYPGLSISESFTVPLPANLPGGQYTVRVGLYDTTGARLSATNHADIMEDAASLGAVILD